MRAPTAAPTASLLLLRRERLQQSCSCLVLSHARVPVLPLARTPECNQLYLPIKCSLAPWHAPGTRAPWHAPAHTPPSMLSALSPGPAPRPPAPTHPRLRPCRSLGHSSSSSSRPVPVRSRVLPRVLLEREHISAQLPELHRSADDQSRRFPGAEGLEKFGKCRIPYFSHAYCAASSGFQHRPPDV